MMGNSGTTTIGMPVLLVRAALTDFLEAQIQQDLANFSRFENRYLRHVRPQRKARDRTVSAMQR